MVHAWKNFNGTVSFVGRRSRNVFLDRIGRQNDLYTSCSPTNPFSCTSLSLFLISWLVSRSTNWDQSIFANSKYGNQMSQFPGIRGKLGLNRRSSNMFLIGFSLGYVPLVGIGIAYSRKYFISFEVNIHSVNDVMYDNLEKLLLFCLLENISS